jgi:ubiquinone/menaquinone biosynthesis C-methylase UbiE
MSFDRLSAHYSWMELVFGGGLMHRCRTRFLDRARACRRGLLVGEGPGKFLADLLRSNREIRVTCVEQSAGMIGQMRRRLRLAGVELARVDFRQMNALDWLIPEEKYDLVATHFFLDCFRAAELERLVNSLARSAEPGAIWLLTDFCEPERGWQKWRAKLLLAGLYAFFQVATGLPAGKLTPPEKYLNAAGFQLRERRLESFGFAHADFWERIAG